MIRDKCCIASWDETKWLVLSSSSFIIPSVFAYYKNLYLYAILLLSTMVMSINYWRKATYSIRRTLDFIFSKLTFIVFFYNGICYVRYTPYLITGYPLSIAFIYCYYLSGKRYQSNHRDWIIYHSLFHYICIYEQLIILDSIDLNNKTTKS
jgi:hypothetical protein